jgi:hypothetical protein
MSQLPEVIATLLDPAHYPDDAPDEVKLIQTQMSFVLLTGKHAYKLRKPVNLGYVDYTTLKRRKLFSDKEVALNRRLCADTYLGVIPITKRDGEIALGGDGEVIDYAVKMKQLPAAGMMDHRLATGALTADMVAAVAGKIADFHAAAETNAEISRFGAIESVKRNINENFDQSHPYIGRALSQRQFDSLRCFFDLFLKDHAGTFDRRIAEGKIRDCHGDLHSAHICFQDDGICIFDCIEFNDRFRYGDTAAEVAFLAMDLDHYGCADLRRVFIDEYLKKSGDTGLCELLRFYQAYRAHVRAKVACFKLDDPFVPDEEKTIELAKARGYFDLAVSYARPKPTLFVMVGFTGCGKSGLAAELTRHLGLVYISSDVTRKKLAGLPPTRHVGDRIDSGIYAREMTEKTYAAMLVEAARALGQGDSAVIDATFLRLADRNKALEVARRHNAAFFVIECRLPEEELRKRLEQRLSETTVSDGTWEVFLSQKAKFEPVDEVPIGRNHVIIDRLRPVAENVREIVDRV